jgi:hypothetical protein
LNLSRAGKELQPHGTIEFPCAGYYEQLTGKTEDIISWHWHEEIEIVYIKDGTLKLQIPAKSFYLEKGDCMAINSIRIFANSSACLLVAFVILYVQNCVVSSRMWRYNFKRTKCYKEKNNDSIIISNYLFSIYQFRITGFSFRISMAYNV